MSKRNWCRKCKGVDYTDFSTCRFCGARYDIQLAGTQKFGLVLGALVGFTLLGIIPAIYIMFRSTFGSSFELAFDPSLAIGHCYEVAPGENVCGYQDADTAINLFELSQTDPQKANRLTYELCDNGSMVELNQTAGMTTDQGPSSKGNLFFQVIGFDDRRKPGHPDAIAFNIKVANKRYAGQSLWIELATLGTMAKDKGTAPASNR